MSDTLIILCLIAGAAGVASHLLYFIRGEHHLEAPRVLGYHALVASMIFLHLIFNQHLSTVKSIQYVLVVVGSYSSLLLFSILLYRTAFHPLNRFPGPRPAKLSKLWHTIQNLNSKNHLLLEKLHREYGPFVRTGK